MKDFNSDLFDPGTVMDSSSSDYSRSASSSDADFGFAFNDSNFSDRILRIEIMGDPVEARPDSDGCTTIADWARHRKRRREDIKKDNGIFFFSLFLFLFFFLSFLHKLNEGKREKKNNIKRLRELFGVVDSVALMVLENYVHGVFLSFILFNHIGFQLLMGSSG